MTEDQWYAPALELSGDDRLARRAARGAVEAEAKGMSPAEASDVMAAIVHGREVRIGKHVAERLLRDASAHSLALAVAALLIVLAAESTGASRGVALTAILALVGIAEGVRGWSTPFRLAIPAIGLNLIALYLAFRPQIGG